MKPLWKPPQLQQPAKGYRYGLDPLFLASFSKPFFADLWCDLGAGCGVLSYLIAKARPNSRGLAIERQQEMCAFAKQNLAGLPVSLICGDLRDFPIKANSIDFAICNPPFFDAPHGRLSPDPQKAASRFSLFGGLPDFFKTISLGLSEEAVFCYILPTERAKLWQPPEEKGWRPKALLNICNHEGDLPVRQCWAWQKNSMTLKTHDLVIFGENRRHSHAFHAFLANGIGISD